MPHVRSADRPREIDLDVCLQGVEDSILGWVGWRDGGIVQLIRGPLPFISGVKLDLVIGCGEMSFDLPEIRYLDGGSVFRSETNLLTLVLKNGRCTQGPKD